MGRSGSVISAPTAVMVAAYKLKNASNWWDQIDESPLWQDRLYHILAALFGIVSFVAVVTFFFFFNNNFKFRRLIFDWNLVIT